MRTMGTEAPITTTRSGPAMSRSRRSASRAVRQLVGREAARQRGFDLALAEHLTEVLPVRGWVLCRRTENPDEQLRPQLLTVAGHPSFRQLPAANKTRPCAAAGEITLAFELVHDDGDRAERDSAVNRKLAIGHIHSSGLDQENEQDL